MANEQNLRPGEYKLSQEEAKRGGQNSAKARREKKTIQKILIDYLQTDVSKDPQFAKIAAKLGIQGEKSIKDVFTIVCMLNAVKSGNLGDLERLSKLLGEENAKENNNGILDELSEYLKNE